MRIEWIREQFKGILSIIDYLDGADDMKSEAKLRTVNLCDMLVNELIVPAKGHGMTNAQRDKLWEMCGRYDVPFREDDYFCSFGSHTMYEGWIGGPTRQAGNRGGLPQTIYVGVEPNGDSHT